MALRSNTGHCLLILEVFKSHSLDAPHLVGLLWTSDHPNAETSIWKIQHSKETDIHAQKKFEPTFSAGEWQQSDVWDRAVTGTGWHSHIALTNKQYYCLLTKLCWLNDGLVSKLIHATGCRTEALAPFIATANTSSPFILGKKRAFG